MRRSGGIFLLWRRRAGLGRKAARGLRARGCARHRARDEAGSHGTGPRRGVRARRPPVRTRGLLVLASGVPPDRGGLQPPRYPRIREDRLRNDRDVRRTHARRRKTVAADEARGVGPTPAAVLHMLKK